LGYFVKRVGDFFYSFPFQESFSVFIGCGGGGFLYTVFETLVGYVLLEGFLKYLPIGFFNIIFFLVEEVYN
jgi:hypothetical protein